VSELGRVRAGSGRIFENVFWIGDREIPSQSKRPLTPKNLRDIVEKSLDDDKAIDIVVIELTGKTEIADYMVIATGHSSRQVGAMANHLSQIMKDQGVKSVAVEGTDKCDWVLIDAGDVLVHLFRPEVREFYELEKLWSVPDVIAGSKAPETATVHA